MCKIIGKPEMAEDPRFAKLIARINNHAEVGGLHRGMDKPAQLVTNYTGTGSEKDSLWNSLLYKQVNNDENKRRRGMFQTVEHARFGAVEVPGMPYPFSAAPGAIKLPAPELGENNQMILRYRLGYFKDEIRELKANKII